MQLVYSTILALVFSFFVIFSFLKLPQLRTKSSEPVVMLAVSDFFFGLIFIVNPDPESRTPGCIFQASFGTFLAASTILWTLVIAFSTYAVVVLKQDPPTTMSSTFVVLVLSALAAALPATTDSYGAVGAWCWIDDSQAGLIWRLATNHCPAFTAMLIIVVLYWRVHLEITRILSVDGAKSERLLRVALKLKYFPLVFFISWTPMIIFRVLNFTNPRSVNRFDILLSLTCLRVSFLQPLGNIIVYCWNETVINAWRTFFCSLSGKSATGQVAELLRVDLRSQSIDDISRESILRDAEGTHQVYHGNPMLSNSANEEVIRGSTLQLSDV